jgi:DNA repair photolyase
MGKRCVRTAERKSMLYKTAEEYGNYTMNHVLGCSYGCPIRATLTSWPAGSAR